MDTTRITLVRPPFYSLIGMSNASHPLSLGYLSAALIQADFQVDVVDGESLNFDERGKLARMANNFGMLMFPYSYSTNNSSKLDVLFQNHDHPVWKQTVASIVATKPDIVGITCFTVSMTAVKIIAQQLKRELPHIKIILGGIHITSQPEQSAHDIPEADYLVIGEGEATIVELCRAILQKNDYPTDIKGIAYMRDGKFIRNAPRELIKDLDALLPPTRQWSSRRYSSHLGFASRGCPYTCNFCDSRTIWTRSVRYHSVERMLSELDEVEKLGVAFFRYSDDTFTLRRERILEWCRQVQAHGYNKKMKFGFGTRVELITRELVEMYAASGVMDISFGIETGSKRISKLISKDFKNADPYEAVKTVNEAGIGSRTYFMLGHPTERTEDVEETIKLIKKMATLPKNYLEINVTCPYPGTELWHVAMEKNNHKPFVDINNYYKMFHQEKPIINISEMSDEVLDKYIKLLYTISARSVLKSRIKVWSKMMMSNPFATIKFVKQRIVGN